MYFLKVGWIRYDPVYSDAKAKAATLGEFNFFNAWMSQPKSQLTTFKAWAGKDSDIRSVPIHPIVRTPALLTSISTATTFHLTILISAAGSYKTSPYLPALLQAPQPGSPQVNPLTVSLKRRIPSRFLSIGNQRKARITGVPLCIQRAGRLHSNPGFILHSTGTTWLRRYLASDNFFIIALISRISLQGEIVVDQAHRGYDVTVDETGKAWYNPF